MSRPINLIPYFGGKTVHVKAMKPFFPDKSNCSHFVDGMAGSAAVAINVNYPLITVNDINQDVINFFEVIRDHWPALKRKIQYTPFSREEFIKAKELSPDKIEKARRFFIRACQGFGAATSQNGHNGWGYDLITGEKNSHFRVDSWQSKLQCLDIVCDKFRGFQIESMPILQLLEKYDHPSIFIYLDPPYVVSTRTHKRYKFEFTDTDHLDLVAAANKSKSLIAISGYPSPLYDSILKDWTCIHIDKSLKNVKRSMRTELLWTNYDPHQVNGQGSLFN